MHLPDPARLDGLQRGRDRVRHLEGHAVRDAQDAAARCAARRGISKREGKRVRRDTSGADRPLVIGKWPWLVPLKDPTDRAAGLISKSRRERRNLAQGLRAAYARSNRSAAANCTRWLDRRRRR